MNFPPSDEDIPIIETSMMDDAQASVSFPGSLTLPLASSSGGLTAADLSFHGVSNESSVIAWLQTQHNINYQASTSTNTPDKPIEVIVLSSDDDDEIDSHLNGGMAPTQPDVSNSGSDTETSVTDPSESLPEIFDDVFVETVDHRQIRATLPPMCAVGTAENSRAKPSGRTLLGIHKEKLSAHLFELLNNKHPLKILPPNAISTAKLDPDGRKAVFTRKLPKFKGPQAQNPQSLTFYEALFYLTRAKILLHSSEGAQLSICEAFHELIRTPRMFDTYTIFEELMDYGMVMAHRSEVKEVTVVVEKPPPVAVAYPEEDSSSEIEIVGDTLSAALSRPLPSLEEVELFRSQSPFLEMTIGMPLMKVNGPVEISIPFKLVPNNVLERSGEVGRFGSIDPHGVWITPDDGSEIETNRVTHTEEAASLVGKKRKRKSTARKSSSKKAKKARIQELRINPNADGDDCTDMRFVRPWYPRWFDSLETGVNSSSILSTLHNYTVDGIPKIEACVDWLEYKEKFALEIKKSNAYDILYEGETHPLRSGNKGNKNSQLFEDLQFFEQITDPQRILDILAGMRKATSPDESRVTRLADLEQGVYRCGDGRPTGLLFLLRTESTEGASLRGFYDKWEKFVDRMELEAPPNEQIEPPSLDKADGQTVEDNLEIVSGCANAGEEKNEREGEEEKEEEGEDVNLFVHQQTVDHMPDAPPVDEPEKIDENAPKPDQTIEPEITHKEPQILDETGVDLSVYADQFTLDTDLGSDLWQEVLRTFRPQFPTILDGAKPLPMALDGRNDIVVIVNSAESTRIDGDGGTTDVAVSGSPQPEIVFDLYTDDGYSKSKYTSPDFSVVQHDSHEMFTLNETLQCLRRIKNSTLLIARVIDGRVRIRQSLLFDIPTYT